MNRTSLALPRSDQPHFTVGQSQVQLSSARPVQWQKVELTHSIGAHDHEFTELVIVLRGPVLHLTQDGVNELQNGEVLVVPPGPIHAYGAPLEAAQLVNIYYLSEWLLWDLQTLWNEGLVPLFFASQLFARPELRQIWQFSLTSAEVAACERELEDIGDYSAPSPSLLWTRGAFCKILVILARAWQRQTPRADLHFRPEIWRALAAVDRHIKAGQGFRVADFAREVGLATGSFSRLFRAQTGLAPSDYFARRRSQHAAHLLLESDLAVGEIAARLGFCDAAHLCRAFSRTHGHSPRAFRARFGQS